MRIPIPTPILRIALVGLGLLGAGPSPAVTYAEILAALPESTWVRPAGRIDLCNAPLPVRLHSAP